MLNPLDGLKMFVNKNLALNFSVRYRIQQMRIEYDFANEKLKDYLEFISAKVGLGF